jgi:hypothetical protein
MAEIHLVTGTLPKWLSMFKVFYCIYFSSLVNLIRLLLGVWSLCLVKELLVIDWVLCICN